MRTNVNKRQRGISLIELIIFIVIISIALTGITLIYINTTKYSADPMVRIRSIELAQSTLEEILLKAYDHSTPVGGGCVRYPAQGNTLCVPPTYASHPAAFNETVLTAEEGVLNRTSFNDVDDYNNLSYCGTGGVADNACTNACLDMTDESGNLIKDNYAGFAICIRVSFAGGAGTEINSPGFGSGVLANDAKRIDVIVTDPLNSKISLSAYRLNF
ncbi:MAG: prepilin-type N-terminal cleavage/methylation domain-containing protein [Gammaproteobacteria bacterium]|nr:prepilin-type N-terminal cleavage/methylation domain-containing protein [Gammaproteobacteria bacterium]